MNRCGTCEEPEANWPVSDPLFAEGAAQCPHCKRHDLNEKAARKNVEK